MANGEDPDLIAKINGAFAALVFVVFVACLLGWVWSR